MSKVMKYGAVLGLGLALASQKAQAAIDIVAYSESGGVTFTPGGLVTPVITGVILIVGAVAALWVINAGVKWLRGFIKTK